MFNIKQLTVKSEMSYSAVPEIEPVETAPVVPDLVVEEETTVATATVRVETSLPVDYVISTPYHEMSFDGPPASPIMESL